MAVGFCPKVNKHKLKDVLLNELKETAIDIYKDIHSDEINAYIDENISTGLTMAELADNWMTLRYNRPDTQLEINRIFIKVCDDRL